MLYLLVEIMTNGVFQEDLKQIMTVRSPKPIHLHRSFLYPEALLQNRAA